MEPERRRSVRTRRVVTESQPAEVERPTKKAKKRNTQTTTAQERTDSRVGKRRKTATRATTSKIEPAPVMERFLFMPMDIVYEIFCQLEPIDLLQLSRASKGLRKLLLSRSFIFIWKCARSRFVGMPDCPEGFSEPRYAQLLFEAVCDGCGVDSSPRAYTVSWQADVKTCADCVPRFFKSHSRGGPGVGLGIPSDMYKYLPKHCYHPNMYSIRHLELWQEQYNSFDEQSKEMWKSAISRRYEQLEEHNAAIYSWRARQAEERRIEDQRLRQELEQRMNGELERLGWGEELEKWPYGRSYFVSSRIPADIRNVDFESVWKSSKPSLIEDLERFKLSRLAQERENLLLSRYKVLQKMYVNYVLSLPPAEHFIPTIADIGITPSMRQIIEDLPKEIEVTETTFNEAGIPENLPTMFAGWKTSVEDRLLGMCQHALGLEKEPDVQYLRLATTVFSCKKCHARMHHPRVLVHDCTWAYDGQFPLANRYPRHCASWNSNGNLTLSLAYRDGVRDILLSLGLDPTTTTVEDVNTLDPMLQCMDCRKSRRGRMTMGWMQAISHSYEAHECRPSLVSWHVPGPQGQQSLQTSMAREHELAKSNGDFLYYCYYCRMQGIYSTCFAHIEEIHKESATQSNLRRHPDSKTSILPVFRAEAP